MSEPTYTLILTESERRAIAHGFGLLVEKLTNARIQLEESPTGGIAQARAVLAPPQNPPSPSPAAASRPTPTEPRDRWARDRRGNEISGIDWAQKGAVAREVKIWKVEQIKPKSKAEFMKVTWQSTEKGYVDANCFDQHLFPWLIKAQASVDKTAIYLVKADKYLNVVGVRA